MHNRSGSLEAPNNTVSLQLLNLKSGWHAFKSGEEEDTVSTTHHYTVTAIHSIWINST